MEHAIQQDDGIEDVGFRYTSQLEAPISRKKSRIR
jgi:hypothetical protein